MFVPSAIERGNKPFVTKTLPNGSVMVVDAYEGVYRIGNIVKLPIKGISNRRRPS